MSQDAFAGLHTVRKLDKLEAYLKAYLNVLKNQSGLQTFYFDAFAGPGRYQLPEGTHRSRLMMQEWPLLPDQLSGHSDWKASSLSTFLSRSRAVVFLDPYGNQVEWATIEAVAATEAVDLWYLFPAGLGVHRQIGRDARIDGDKRRSLNRLFGTTGWLDECVAPDDGLQGELFDATTPRHTKIATPDSITRYMIKRMKTVFTGGVLDEWLPLGRQGHHSFSLLFAWANPSEKAKKAGEIARAVMRSGRRGRTK